MTLVDTRNCKKIVGQFQIHEAVVGKLKRGMCQSQLRTEFYVTIKFSKGSKHSTRPSLVFPKNGSHKHKLPRPLPTPDYFPKSIHIWATDVIISNVTRCIHSLPHTYIEHVHTRHVDIVRITAYHFPFRLF